MTTAALVAAVLFTAPAAHAGQPAQQKRVGRQVADFKLRDYRGRETSLSEFKSSKLVVMAFLGTECPLAKLYATRLVKLHEHYHSYGVTILGINANVQDSITEIAAHARRHELPFPVLKDVGNVVADQMGAVRTPEVFVLDAQRVVRYWGRIDDQYGIGLIREEPSRNDLAVALDELLMGWQVSTPSAEAVGCHIGRVTEPDETCEVTFSNQIARLLNRHCVECHRAGQIAPFALTDYHEVAGWAEMIEEVVDQNRMPPWHADRKHGKFHNERGLNQEERELLHRWVAAGAPEGDPSQLPPPPQFTKSWQLPREPDLVLNMRKFPFRVSAEGNVNYQYFDVDTGFTEDKWIRGVEVRPGNHSVVHHILVYVKDKRSRVLQGDGYLGVYVPGMHPQYYPEGMAKLVPAGSRLMFQVHYTPVGTPQEDMSKVGLIFARPEEVEQAVVSASVGNYNFFVPAGAEKHRIQASSHSLKSEIQLLSMMPHMHVRGSAFRYELETAGGREVLLDVPHYDFNWQTSYELAQPRTLKVGAKLHCTAEYDNSAENPANPDSSVIVRFGPQVDDEMMFGYFDYAMPRDDYLRSLGRR